MNKNKAKPKKYAIAQFCKKVVRCYKTEEEYEELLKIIQNSNRRNLNNFEKNKNDDEREKRLIFGNVQRETNSNGEIIATISVYTLLCGRKTLEEIDRETMQMANMGEFLEKYGHLRRNGTFRPEIISFGKSHYKDDNNKMVKHSIGINSDKLFFEKDKIYMSPEYIKQILINETEIDNYSFFTRLWQEFLRYPSATDDCVDMRVIIDKVRYYGSLKSNLISLARKIYEDISYKKNLGKFKIDKSGKRIEEYKGRRNFASFIKRCESEGIISHQLGETNEPQEELKLKLK